MSKQHVTAESPWAGHSPNNMSQKSIRELRTVHPRLWEFKMKVTKAATLWKSVRLKISPLNNPATFFLKKNLCTYVFEATNVLSKVFIPQHISQGTHKN